VYADPGSLLRLPCASVKGLGSFIALIAELDDRLPTSGHFILNTSFSYNGDFTQFSKRQRIEHALFWRLLVAGKQDRFMHTTAAGNEGVASNSLPNATYATPFALSARFDTPMEMLQGTAVSSKDTADLNLLYTAAVNTASSAAVKTRNLLVIGSSDLDGNLSSFSNLPSDVRMIGETVTLPCAVADAECAAGSGVALQALVDGTSFAAPQVAGLAAWLWSLSPALSVDETIAILKNCYNGKWVDAYKAVLSLDHSEATAVVRKWILDVADGNGQQGSNGAFDEKDIQMYIDSLLAYEAERVSAVPPYSRDHSIFDLNGDGFTGDTTGTPSTAPFDLDVNVPPAYATVSVTPCNDPTVFDTTYDEHAVTDRDILRYYAYSSLYQGVDSTRDRLFGVSCSPFWAGPDSSSYRTYISCFPLNIQEDDTNAVGFTSVNIDETRDSLTALCKDTVSSGYRFQLAMSGDASLSASVGPSNVSVNGGASLHSTATATAPPEPSPCRFGIAGFLSSVNMVRFAMGGDKFSVPMSLVVSGSVTPTNASGSSVALARCIVKLFVVDTTASARLAGATEPQAPAFLTFDSDVNSLPFQMNSFLTLLQEHNVYQMEIFAQAYSFVTTQVPPGTGEAKIDVSVSLFAGD
jgi:hypothetical protein